jgi:sugar phosphate isomerase/epimerase
MFPSFNPDHIGLQLPIEESAAAAQRHGFAGLDFPIAQAFAYVQEHGAAAFTSLLQGHGLVPGNWNLPFMPYRLDEADWRQAIEDLKPMAECAEQIGALRTAMWILPGSDDLTFEQNFALHVDRFAPVVELLRPHGIRVGLEFVGPKTSRRDRTYEFVYDLAGIRKLQAALGAGTGLLLDCWHWYTSGATVADMADLTNEDLVHIHINDAPAGIDRDEQIDNRRKLPGTTGVIDIQGFLGALAAAGYDGPVTAEPFDQELNVMEPTEERVARNAETVLGVMQSYL